MQVIHKQSRWLVKIINDLVDLSRIDANGKRIFNPLKVDCAELVTATLDLLPPFPGRTPPRLALIPHLPVCVDPAKFQQALLNVIDNAYKYSDAGDVDVVMIEDMEQQRIGIRVIDNGRGMTAAQLEHAFDRFWRADNSGNTPGTGLGLCLTREIMVILNGSIDITSMPGSGTQATLWLPRTCAAQEERE